MPAHGGTAGPTEYILVRPTATTGWARAPETELPDEATLQELVKAHPETLPFGHLGDALPLLTVGRESPLSGGYADLIGLDPTGLITVIELRIGGDELVCREDLWPVQRIDVPDGQ